MNKDTLNHENVTNKNEIIKIYHGILRYVYIYISHIRSLDTFYMNKYVWRNEIRYYAKLTEKPVAPKLYGQAVAKLLTPLQYIIVC